MFYLTFCILLCFSSNAYTQSVPYDCRNNSIVPMEDFTLERYMGDWYVYEYTSNPLEVGTTCTHAKVDLLDNGDTIVTTYRTNITTGTELVTSGKVNLVGPGKYEVAVDEITGVPGTIDVFVLDTDYSNYLVEYVCTDLFGSSNLTEIIWISTRERFPTEDVINIARSAVTANGLSMRNVEKVEKSNCAIYA